MRIQELIKTQKNSETKDVIKTYPYPEFLTALAKLRPEELLGLAKFMGIKLFKDDEKDEKGNPLPQSGEFIVQGIIEKYPTLGRKVRRQILKIVKQAGSK